MKPRDIAGAMVLALAAVAPAFAADDDPPLPPGRDAGGTPVAIVGPGIDYTREGLPARLARDGEGEIIGYDFVGNDRRPYDIDSAEQRRIVDPVLGEGQTTTLIAVRYDDGDVLSLGKALNYAGATPAKIILMARPPNGEKTMSMIASAARHFRDRLFVVPAGDTATDLDAVMPKQAREVPNILIVAAADGAGILDPASSFGATTVELSTDGRDLDNPLSADAALKAPVTTTRAAARIAALAARLLAVEPYIAGEALKVRISGLADRSGDASRSKTRSGFIARPARHFWLE